MPHRGHCEWSQHPESKRWTCIIISELNCFVAESQLIKHAFQFWSDWLKDLIINRWEIPRCSHDLYLSCWHTGPHQNDTGTTWSQPPEPLDRATWASPGLGWEGAGPRHLPRWVHGVLGLNGSFYDFHSSLSMKTILFLVVKTNLCPCPAATSYKLYEPELIIQLRWASVSSSINWE